MGEGGLTFGFPHIAFAVVERDCREMGSKGSLDGLKGARAVSSASFSFDRVLLLGTMSSGAKNECMRAANGLT